MSNVVLYCWCHSDSASVLLHFTFCYTCSLCIVELMVQFPARGSTLESVIMPFSWCVVTVTLPMLCRSTSSDKPSYIHFRCVAGIHGGFG